MKLENIIQTDSMGEMVEEGIGGQSIKDFFAKLYIAYIVSREIHYCLRLFKNKGYLEVFKATECLNDWDELLRIMGSVLQTMKAKPVIVISN